MHIDRIDIDYHSIVYSGCAHKLAIIYDGIPMVQRLFTRAETYNVHRFSLLSLFPFECADKSPVLPMPIEMLSINGELDYNSFHSLN